MEERRLIADRLRLYLLGHWKMLLCVVLITTRTRWNWRIQMSLSRGGEMTGHKGGGA